MQFKKLKKVATHIYMVRKTLGVVKDHTFRYVCNFEIDFAPLTNDKHQVLSPAHAKTFIREEYENLQLPLFFRVLVGQKVK